MQREHFLATNGIEDPVRQLDFDPLQAPVKPVLAANRGGVNQPEAVALLLVARADIGGDAGAGEAVVASQSASIMVLGTGGKIRGFRCQTSKFQVPGLKNP